MGLDIYLYSRAKHDEDERREELWEQMYAKYHDENGNLREGMTSEQYDEERKRVVPDYESSPDMPSEKYPDHLFKKNYLRSSYNDGGFNRAVPDMLGRDEGGLYWIFDPVIQGRDEPYETVLDAAMIDPLGQVKARALQVAADLRDCDPLRVASISNHMGDKEWMWDHLPTETEVLEWYREEKKKHAERPPREGPGWADIGEGFSTAKGDVFGFDKGLEILAVTVGANPLASFSAMMPPNTVGGQMGLMPNAIIVYRMEDEGKQSYIQSAEIIAEFCDYAVELIKRDGDCVMHWSG